MTATDHLRAKSRAAGLRPPINPLTGKELAAKLQAKDGPLDLVMPENIDRIETNLQIAHAPKSRGTRLPHRLSAESVSLR